MSEPQLTIDVSAFRRDINIIAEKLSVYQSLSKQTPVETLRKKGKDLAVALGVELRKTSPGKGTIRSSQLDRLKNWKGYGLKIRDSVRQSVEKKYGVTSDENGNVFFGKRKRQFVMSRKVRMNLEQLLVRAELNIRERGRGFIAFGGKFAGVDTIKDGETLFSRDRALKFLADANLVAPPDGATLTLWNNASHALIAGLRRPKAQGAISSAFKSVVRDMDVYIERKQAALLRQSQLA